ncbi:hypothetical protein FHU41_000957 [Psychromicrobium silvestre]|uniref:Uncharacterized protein n=1 Tax=Psychromicrobium silvestre TaxID=1645614 RepID=A0A7Y9LSF0_9MICC|nr:hypothetical protein [Psychromicrobium silvestre]NYE94736.1 hypothetical protein [Psychromicrobium silvestre]
MTPEEASKEFYGLLDTIQAMAPGDWKSEDYRPGGYCDYQGHGDPDGKQFAGYRSRSPLSLAERQILREKVEALYTSHGYTVQTFNQTTASNNLILTIAQGPNGLTIGLHTGDQNTSVDGQSRCVPNPTGQ